jgi:hypothetical protein
VAKGEQYAGVVVLLGEAHRLPVMQGVEEVSPSYVTPYYTSPLTIRFPLLLAAHHMIRLLITRQHWPLAMECVIL